MAPGCAARPGGALVRLSGPPQAEELPSHFTVALVSLCLTIEAPTARTVAATLRPKPAESRRAGAYQSRPTWAQGWRAMAAAAVRCGDG